MRDFFNFLRSKNSALAETLGGGQAPPSAAGAPPLPADYAGRAPMPTATPKPKRPLGANRKFLKRFQQGTQDIAANYQAPGQDVDITRATTPEEDAEYQASQQLLAPDEEIPTQNINPYMPWRQGAAAVPSKTTAPPARRGV